MNWIYILLRFLPRNLLSRVTGWLVNLSLPGVLRLWALKLFAGHYRLNLVEAEKNLSDYPTIGALFARKLRPGVRPIGGGNALHPSDSELSCAGIIQQGQLLQIKGWTYDIHEFLGRQASEFEGGLFVTYYLCPTDYHRVHSPIDGRLNCINHIAGTLWPVNLWSVSHIKNLFNLNERVVFEIDGAQGPVALVMVGATNVGEIRTSFDPEIISNRRPGVKKTYSGILVSRGEELGVFHMGSTVVVCYGPGWNLQPPKFPQQVKIGTSLES